MMTMPWNGAYKKILKKFIEDNDIHDWTIGYEVGRGGYRHLQVRIRCNKDFGELQRYFRDAHIEEGSDDWEYEKKTGYFVSSDDHVDVRKCRFGKLRSYQQRMLDILRSQSDRGITVWWDPIGSIGKSYLSRNLIERRIAYYVPPTAKDVKSIIQYVCSGYQGQPIIIIDIPRSAKWDESLYCGIETIKDGIVYDTRYSAKLRDIWGCKVLVLTNTLPKLDALSMDRWDIWCKNTDDTLWKVNIEKLTFPPPKKPKAARKTKLEE